METEVKIAFDSEEELLKITSEEWFNDYCMDGYSPVKYIGDKNCKKRTTVSLYILERDSG